MALPSIDISHECTEIVKSCFALDQLLLKMTKQKILRYVSTTSARSFLVARVFTVADNFVADIRRRQIFVSDVSIKTCRCLLNMENDDEVVCVA